MEITKLSSKGQVVIPDKLRQGIEVGTPFVVTKQNDLIILKKVDGLTEQEKEEMKELDEIWREIDEGKGVTMSKKEFFKEMESW